MEPIVGETYGELFVLGYAVKRDKHRRKMVGCRCSCGNLVVTASVNVLEGRQNCGCVRRNHMYKTRPWRIWSNMKQRCRNPTCPEFEQYGAMGVEVDNRWDTFEGFWADMQQGYSDNLTLDRIDGKRGYSKENCRWATYEVQSINRGLFKNNRTGYTGVYFDEQKNTFMAIIKRNRKDVVERFPVKAYGYNGAFTLAIIARERMEYEREVTIDW